MGTFRPRELLAGAKKRRKPSANTSRSRGPNHTVGLAGCDRYITEVFDDFPRARRVTARQTEVVPRRCVRPLYSFVRRVFCFFPKAAKANKRLSFQKPVKCERFCFFRKPIGPVCDKTREDEDYKRNQKRGRTLWKFLKNCSAGALSPR